MSAAPLSAPRPAIRLLSETTANRISEALLHMDGLAEISEGEHIPVPEKRRAAR